MLKFKGFIFASTETGEIQSPLNQRLQNDFDNFSFAKIGSGEGYHLFSCSNAIPSTCKVNKSFRATDDISELKTMYDGNVIRGYVRENYNVEDDTFVVYIYGYDTNMNLSNAPLVNYLFDLEVYLPIL